MSSLRRSSVRAGSSPMMAALCLAATTILVMTLRVPAAHAGHYWYPNGGYSGPIVHMHPGSGSRTLGVMNRVDEDGDLNWIADQARLQWDWGTVLSLPLTGSHAGASIQIDDHNYGETNWAGLAETFAWHTDCIGAECHAPNGTLYDYEQGHYNHSHTHLNLFYIGAGNSRNLRQNVACHELGHALGLGHIVGVAGNGTGCMITPASALEPVPRQHDFDMINTLYTGNGH